MRNSPQATKAQPIPISTASSTRTNLTDHSREPATRTALVVHNEDGDWQFLDGGMVSDDAVVLHIYHVFDKHSDLRSLTDLPEGWAAERDSVAGEWRRYPWEEPD